MLLTLFRNLGDMQQQGSVNGVFINELLLLRCLCNSVINMRIGVKTIMRAQIHCKFGVRLRYHLRRVPETLKTFSRG